MQNFSNMQSWNFFENKSKIKAWKKSEDSHYDVDVCFNLHGPESAKYLSLLVWAKVLNLNIVIGWEMWLNAKLKTYTICISYTMYIITQSFTTAETGYL